MPGSKHAWPNSAACWSPAIPLTGTESPAAASGSVTPNRPLLGRTSGRQLVGTPKSSQSSDDHCRVPMSKSMVRLALDGSVACTRPPVSRYRSHASTVPNARSGDASTPPSCRSHASFEAEKYGSSTSPVRSRISGSSPAARRSSQSSAVRRSCQTIARCSGRPVRRLHTTTVSRWFVMPMHAIVSPAASVARATSPNVATVASQISSASCSTQPGCGKYCGNSRFALRSTRPVSSIASVRIPDVPASMLRTTAISSWWRGPRWWVAPESRRGGPAPVGGRGAGPAAGTRAPACGRTQW